MKVDDIYSELKLDLSSYNSSMNKAMSRARELGGTLNTALGSGTLSNIKNANNALNGFLSNSSRAVKSIQSSVRGAQGAFNGFSKSTNNAVGSLRRNVTGVQSSVTKLNSTMRGSVASVNKGIRTSQSIVKNLGKTTDVSLGNITKNVDNAKSSVRNFQNVTGNALKNIERNANYAKKAFDGIGKTPGFKNISSDTNKINNSLRSTSSAAKEAESSLSGIGNSAKSVGRIVQGILISQGFYQLTGAIKNSISEVYNFKKSTELAAVSFKTLLGNAQAANTFMRQLEDFAAVTPYQLDNVREYGRRLLAAGFEAKKVIPTLRTLGDATTVAGGDPDTLNRIVNIFTKIKAQGTITAREVNRLASTGIQIYPILQKELGLTAEEIKNIGKAGISADTAISAILKGWNEKFGGTSEAVGKTLEGMLSNIQDNFVIVMSEAFDGLFEKVKGVVSGIGGLLQRMRDVVRSQGVGGLIEQFIPPDLQDKVRVLVVEFQQFGSIIRDVGIIAAQGFRPLLDIVIILEPIIAAVAQVLNFVAQAAANGSTWVRVLVGAFSGLFIAGKLVAILTNFRKALLQLKIVTTVIGWIKNLAGAFRLLSAAVLTNPIAAGIAIIAGTILALVVSSDKASKALDGIMERLAKLFGVDIGKMLQPQDMNKAADGLDKIGKNVGGLDTGKLNDAGKGLDNIGKGGSKAGKGAKKAGDGIKKTGKDAKKANKDLKDYLFSFDEIYKIPEEMQKAAAGAGGGGTGGPDGAGGAGGPIGDLANQIGNLPNLADEAKRGAHDVGESIKDQLERMPPIMLPGFRWPPFPPLPEVSFEPVFEPIIEWTQVKIPRAIDDFVTYLRTVPALVQEAFEPVGESLRQPILDFTTETLPVLEGWIGQTVADLNQWALDAGTAIGTFVQPSLETINNWAIQGVEGIRTFTANTKVEIADWATSTAGIIKEWADGVGPSLALIGTVGIAMVTQFANSTQGALEKWAPAATAPIAGFAIATKSTIDGWIANSAKNFGGWSTNVQGTFKDWKVRTGSTVNGWANNVGERVKEWIRDTKNRYRGWATDTGGILTAWSGHTAGTVGSWASNTLGKVKSWSGNTIGTLGNWVGNTIGQVKSWDFTQQGTFRQFVSGAWDKFKDFDKKAGGAMDQYHGLSPSIQNAGGSTRKIQDVFKIMGIGIIGGLAGTTLPGIAASFVSKAPALAAAATAFFTGVPVAAKDKTGKAKNELKGIPGFISRLKGSVSSAASNMVSGFSRAWSGAVSKVKGWIGGIQNRFHLGATVESKVTMSQRRYNHAANGGMISRNQMIEVGEQNKRETIVPLQNPKALAPVYDYIAQTVQRAVGNQDTTTVSASAMRPLYVGTLVADEKGLKELYRKFEVYNIEENERRGF